MTCEYQDTSLHELICLMIGFELNVMKVNLRNQKVISMDILCVCVLIMWLVHEYASFNVLNE